MEIDIESERENEILERKELKAIVDHSGNPTPSESDIRNKIAAERDLDKNSILVEGIYSRFGSSTSEVFVKILENPEDFLEVQEEESEEVTEEEAGTSEEEKEEEKQEESKEEQEKESKEEESEKGKESGKSDEEEKSEEVEESSKESEDEVPEEVDYEEIVDNSISDAKEELKDLSEVNYPELLEAEENNKDRKTFKKWIENQIEE